MSGRDRDRDRDRDRGSRSTVASARTNEYFVPKEGIDREVITADICRYLGNDALVRPGTYENPQTRQVQQGYFITAYRNLTTAMIADLKADSERWDAERRATASRGMAPNVEYRSSTTHQSRQYYGPTEQAPGATPGYSVQAPPTQAAYDTSYTSYSQPSYVSAQPAYVPESNYYTVAEYAADPRSGGRAPPVQSGTVPRTGTVQYAQAQTPAYQQDARSYYAQPAPVSSTPYTQQAADPFYGRTQPAVTSYDTADPYDTRQYQDPAYTQAPVPNPSTTATSGSSRRDRDRDDRERRHRHR